MKLGSKPWGRASQEQGTASAKAPLWDHVSVFGQQKGAHGERFEEVTQCQVMYGLVWKIF